MTVHDFSKCLAATQVAEYSQRCIALYRRHFGETTIVSGDVNDPWLQRHGCDRVVIRDGKALYIEEKFRSKDYGDFLVEIYSQWYARGDSRNAIGWTVDDSKQTDYLTWIVVPSGHARVLPFRELRRACKCRISEWISGGFAKMRAAENKDYDTINYSVSWRIVFEALGQRFQREPW